jgi:hypothetical protein
MILRAEEHDLLYRLRQSLAHILTQAVVACCLESTLGFLLKTITTRCQQIIFDSHDT